MTPPAQPLNSRWRAPSGFAPISPRTPFAREKSDLFATGRTFSRRYDVRTILPELRLVFKAKKQMACEMRNCAPEKHVFNRAVRGAPCPSPDRAGAAAFSHAAVRRPLAFSTRDP
jgi:hypothetical protein